MTRKAVLLLSVITFAGCSTADIRSAATVAMSRNPVAATEIVGRNKAVAYAANPGTLIRDIRNFKQMVEKFRKAVAGEWGDKNVEMPEPKQYVKYTQNYQSRALVDFDGGMITVQTVNDKMPRKSLKNAIVTTLLTPDDPRAVDMYSEKTIELEGRPFLYGEVLDQNNKPVKDIGQAEIFADYVITAQMKTKTIAVGNDSKQVFFVEIRMVENHIYVRAQKYRQLVTEFAERYSLSRSLVYSIIKTESDFNPFAVSSAPAFGLMQIIPSQAGRDAYRFVKKNDRVPTGEYLFDARNNIELGTAYLNLLHFNYLEKINDSVSREYCAIAAYNGGVGGVLRVFSQNKDTAVKLINDMKPQEVYEKIRRSMPAETQNYLKRLFMEKENL